MQWNSDPGAGFSTAPRPAMPRPPVEKGPFAYRRVNVERQRNNPGSFLMWMERLIRTRREWPEFGWGDHRVLDVGDDSVLAHTAEWQDGEVLALHNFGGRRAKVHVNLPRGRDRGRWHRLVGSRASRVDQGSGSSRAATTAASNGRLLEVELPPHGYIWLGHRVGP